MITQEAVREQTPGVSFCICSILYKGRRVQWEKRLFYE